MITKPEFFDKVQAHFYKRFPNGKATIRRAVLGHANDHFFIKFFLIPNTEDQSFGLLDNDPLRFHFSISDAGEAETFNPKSVSEAMQDSLCVKSTDPYYAMGSVKFKTRKKTGTGEQILKQVCKAIDKAADLTIENWDNIYFDPRRPHSDFEIYKPVSLTEKV